MTLEEMNDSLQQEKSDAILKLEQKVDQLTAELVGKDNDLREMNTERDTLRSQVRFTVISVGKADLRELPRTRN